MKEEVDVLCSPSLIVLMVPVDVKQHLKKKTTCGSFRVQELCERSGGCPGSPSLIVRKVSVDVKQH